MANDPQIDYDALSKDATFAGMPLEQQRAYLSSVDKDFAGLDPVNQNGYISHLVSATQNYTEAGRAANPIISAPASNPITSSPLVTHGETLGGGGVNPASQETLAGRQEAFKTGLKIYGSTVGGAVAPQLVPEMSPVAGLLLRSAAAGTGSGGGALVGGATPSEAAKYAAGAAVAQPVAEGLSAGAVRLFGSKPVVSSEPSLWESLWNRLTGKAQYAENLEAAKNVNLSKYRLSEQTAQSAVDEANAKVVAAKAALPAGEAGQWADLNTAVGATPRSVRIGKGVSDLSMSYGNAGRGLLREGFDNATLAKMTPPEQAAFIGPKWQAAGKAVQDAADEATESGTTLDAGASVNKVLKDRIADPGLQEKAIDLINSHQRELGIENIREATPTQALALRQALRNDANFGLNSTTDSMKGIGRALYSAVSNDLHDAVPEMKVVDQHYGDLAEAVSAVQRQTQRYAVGKWTPPQTAVEKAQAAVPEMPNVSPYKPLPAAPSAWQQIGTVGKNLAPWVIAAGGAGSLGYGGYRLLHAAGSVAP